MASQVYVQINGPAGSLATGKSCTEGTVGECTDEISGLSVGEVWEGNVVNSFQGTYNAGTAVVWLEDNRTKERFLLGCIAKTTSGGVTEYLERPVKITKDMVLNAMTQAVA